MFMNPNLAFRSRRELTMEDVAQLAPSVFGEIPHASRSDRYQHISTAEVLKRLIDEDFYPVVASQQRVRDKTRAAYTRHVIRLRHRGDNFKIDSVGDSFPEVVLMNSHDGSTTYKLMLGIFRLVCSNGMIAGDTFSGITVRHKGDIAGRVIEGAYQVINDSERLSDRLAAWQSLELSNKDAEAYGRKALRAVYGDRMPELRADQILAPRRTQDTPNNMWTVFNRVQENVIQGGLSGVRSHGRRRAFTTRAITGVNRDVAVNQALWNMTDQFIKDRELIAA